MTRSARNQIKGTASEVVKGQTTAHARVEIGDKRGGAPPMMLRLSN